MTVLQDQLGLERFNTFNLSQEIWIRLKALAYYDLSPITHAFTDESHRQGHLFACEQIYPILIYFGRADLPLAKSIELEFRRFVALSIIRSGLLTSPSGPVDMYWHFFILRTAAYRKFCEKVWNIFS